MRTKARNLHSICEWRSSHHQQVLRGVDTVKISLLRHRKQSIFALWQLTANRLVNKSLLLKPKPLSAVECLSLASNISTDTLKWLSLLIINLQDSAPNELISGFTTQNQSKT